MPERSTSKPEFFKQFFSYTILMNAQLKTIKSDNTYKIDFTYHDRQSFVDNELKATDVCEKRGLIYDRTKLPLLPYGPGNFTCVSTFEGS